MGEVECSVCVCALTGEGESGGGGAIHDEGAGQVQVVQGDESLTAVVPPSITQLCPIDSVDLTGARVRYRGTPLVELVHHHGIRGRVGEGTGQRDCRQNFSTHIIDAHRETGHCDEADHMTSATCHMTTT